MPNRPEKVPTHQPQPAIPTINILGVGVHRVDVAMTLDQIGAWIAAPSATCRQICTVNPEFIIDARRAPAFAAVLSRADLRVPDGVGVLWAARLLGAPLQQRVTGSDGIYQICERAAAEGWRVYLLGAAPGVAEQAAQILMARYAGLQVVGTYAGSPSDADWPAIQSRLAAVEPDILFVAYGHPRQDFWIDAHRHELPVKVAVGIGGALDFVTGVAQRAPQWMQQLGLEWLHRLIRQPWRWRRMVKLPVFAARVVLEVAGRFLPATSGKG
ncbi:MAG: WecB/TagA/CpsF family glycosyltransferase [Caldilineaceae bacterium]|nr:WecB/TagA/CpsF family glycosyltransferase [Caldilineaceae bacterium]